MSKDQGGLTKLVISDDKMGRVVGSKFICEVGEEAEGLIRNEAAAW